MGPTLRSLGAVALLAVTVSGCETKITQISIVCRPGHQPTEPVRWFYASKVDPTVISRIPVSMDITLHYTGGEPRAVPPITTYFYRENGATLRVASSAKATMPPNGVFTYHVDPGGYVHGLTATGRGGVDELKYVIVVDSGYFGGLLSQPTCQRWPDRHLDVDKASEVPNLKDKHPLNMAADEWIAISPQPTEVIRTEGNQVSTYAFFQAPIGLTETKNEITVPQDTSKQEAEVGVTTATPTYGLVFKPAPQAGTEPSATKGG
jgi:hypothetical protein